MPKLVDKFPNPPPTILNAPQIRLLEALRDGGWLDRNALNVNAKVDISWVGVWIGRFDPATRAASEAKWKYTSLLTLGYVEERNLEIEEGIYERSYHITPAGLKALKDQSK